MRRGAWLLFAAFAIAQVSSHVLAVSPSRSIGPAAAIDGMEPQPSPRVVPLPGQVAQQSDDEALLRRYCIGCHNDRLKTANLALDTLDLSNPGAHTEVWEKVIRKLRAGVMPPAGRPRPDNATTERFVARLEDALDRLAAAQPDPGPMEPFHRLNRVEYQNAIRDLLDLKIDANALLPTDDVSYGFDNIAGTLKLSPVLVERYLSAAQRIARLAVGSPPASPAAEVFRLPGDLSQYDRMDGLPLGTRGGTAISYNFPQDAEYDIRVELLKNRDGSFYLTERHELEVSIDGERVELFTLNPTERRRGQPRDSDADGDSDPQQPSGVFRVRTPVKAGPHKLAVTFIKKTSAVEERPRQRFLRVYNASYVEYMVSVGNVSITGPFDSSGAGETPSRRRLFTCQPASTSREAECAKTILSSFARRAYRRPVTDGELRTLLESYEEGRAEGGFESGIELALQRVLASPFFLFRVEAAPAADNRRSDSKPAPQRIGDLALAERLSFFLWSSIPDEQLLDLAVRGKLKDPVVLEAQVRRMLADPKSEALATSFASQWLHLRNLPAITPYERMFPDFDEGLRRTLSRETELFFDSIVREDRGLLELLTADYSFLNERAARHYGVKGVYGPDFRRVPLGDERRRGLLGHGSILAVTSQANRTSPVVRGKWILENILGTPPPPPPPDVPPLPESDSKGPLTMRQRMVEHRANPICSSCHSVMDPLGLALENFDAVGQWRDRDAGLAVDASGSLPDGTAFDGVVGLREALLKRSDLFVTTFTEKLLTYALGRGVDYRDAPTVRAIARSAAKHDNRISAFILGIVNSTPFQMRRAQS